MLFQSLIGIDFYMRDHENIQHRRQEKHDRVYQPE